MLQVALNLNGKCKCCHHGMGLSTGSRGAEINISRGEGVEWEGVPPPGRGVIGAGTRGADSRGGLRCFTGMKYCHTQTGIFLRNFPLW